VRVLLSRLASGRIGFESKVPEREERISRSRWLSLMGIVPIGMPGYDPVLT